MQYRDGVLQYSPTDLSCWLSSPYVAWMSRYALEYPQDAPRRDEPDELLSRLAGRGLAHEQSLEQQFAQRGLTVVNVMARVQGLIDSTTAAASQRAEVAVTRAESTAMALSLTIELMQSGVDVIAQAALEQQPFMGFADFLVKVPGRSALGDYHYQVWDTKLARRVKPGMVLQLCCYVDMLDAIQQRRAEDLVLALGDGSREFVPTVDCFAYYRAVKQAFLLEQAGWSADAEPDPALYNAYGDWSGYAKAKLEQSDHLSRVARITRRQINRLEQAGIHTLSQLAASADRVVPGIDSSRMRWLVQQAALQSASAAKEIPDYQLLAPDTERVLGLQALPDESPLDVFFDIEGFPLEGDGLEYLWGCTYWNEQGEQDFRDWWAHDPAAERRAFEGFIDWVHQRWRCDPGMHIYHYAPYETTACKRLMGAYGTRESELDDLLRNGVFVDLYAVVTHGMQIGEPKYSIKNVERLYRAGRDTTVASGADSVVVYDQWREAFARGDDSDDWRESDILAGLRHYNRDDCDSTLELCQWLRSHRASTPATQGSVLDVPVEPELSEAVIARHALRDRLLVRAGEPTLDATTQRLYLTLAGLLEFHRREEKNAWWRYFERMDPANTQLAEDPACIADCIRTAMEPFKPTPRARNLAYEYQFDTRQEIKGIASKCYIKGWDASAESSAERTPLATVLFEHSAIDDGRIVVQCSLEPPRQLSLVPNEIVRADPIPAAIDAVIARIESGEANDSALMDFLQRRKPSIRGHAGGPIVQSEETRLQDTLRAVQQLDNSCLVIQGPPGAGKSFTGARIIAALVSEGKRVGVSSNSHAAINNLVVGAARYCQQEQIAATFICAKNTHDEMEALEIDICANARMADRLVDGCVIGTTAWGFCRQDMVDALDVLIVDEAGQVSVANLAGMSQSACNLVLMGDQRQLGQPTQGTHPADSGLSVLDYRLGEAPAIDPEHGVFLGTTYRMHPAVNALVSRHVYAGQLETAAATRQRTLVTTGSNDALDCEAGVVYLPAHHEGNAQYSEEEVALVVDAVESLKGRRLKCADGSEKRIELSDMLFVAPYNAQVARLQSALGDEARVGSVDRFQGQEAPIVFLSLCSSDASASPRGLSFLFDRNRLNVAVSRAETLCVIVAHPRLAVTPVATLADLKRVNFVAALTAGQHRNEATGVVNQ